MNPAKLMAVTLCAAASVTTTAFAEDDFGIESASPVAIADPVNPQPGAKFYAYRLSKFMKWDELKESIAKLPSQPAVKTLVDKSSINFSMGQIGKSDAGVGRWEGFIKCKRAGTYTFVLQKQKLGTRSLVGYSFAINGRPAISFGSGEVSCDVKLKVGWNKLDLVCQFGDNKRTPLAMTFKPKDSDSDPRPIAPKDLFYDKKPEEDW